MEIPADAAPAMIRAPPTARRKCIRFKSFFSRRRPMAHILFVVNGEKRKKNSVGSKKTAWAAKQCNGWPMALVPTPSLPHRFSANRPRIQLASRVKVFWRIAYCPKLYLCTSVLTVFKANTPCIRAPPSIAAVTTTFSGHD